MKQPNLGYADVKLNFACMHPAGCARRASLCDYHDLCVLCKQIPRRFHSKKFFPAQSFEPSDPDLLRFATARSSQDLAFFHCSTLLCGRHQQVNQAFQKQVCLGEFSIHLLDWHAPAKHQAFPSNLPTKYYPDPVMRNFSAQIGTGSYIFLDTNIFKDIKFETKTFSEEIFKLGNFRSFP